MHRVVCIISWAAWSQVIHHVFFAEIGMSKVAEENAANCSEKSNSAGRVSLDSGTNRTTKMLGQKKEKVAAEDLEAATTQGNKAGSKEPEPACRHG